jgi:hypothetical protein
VWLPFIGVGRGDGRPGSGGELSRGRQLRERRRGDWRRVMRGNEGHGTPVHLVHLRDEEGDGQRLLAQWHTDLQPAAAASVNQGRRQPSLVGWFGLRWVRKLDRFQ